MRKAVFLLLPFFVKLLLIPILVVCLGHRKTQSMSSVQSSRSPAPGRVSVFSETLRQNEIAVKLQRVADARAVNAKYFFDRNEQDNFPTQYHDHAHHHEYAEEHVHPHLHLIRAGEQIPAIQGEPRDGLDEKIEPLVAAHFDPYVKLKAIRTHWDDRFLYVESNGIPAHPMMVGITAWQQQVPLPQKYFGDNAWRIPLKPIPAKKPVSAKNRFLRGAIAVAVNGIPIFNPLNNRGDDAFLFGELDKFGGHCGRADDYHYHIAPIHLQELIGRDQPIAYALDGYPIYGYQDEKAPDFSPLDNFNGHKDKNGNYHYHATKAYPYLNGGFFGEIVEREGQVDPQPRAEPLRAALPPLKDAKITKFEEVNPKSYRLTYDVKGKQGTVSYTLNENGSVDFEFTDVDGRKNSETYSVKRRGVGVEGKPRSQPKANPSPSDVQRQEGIDRPPPERNPAKHATELEVRSASIDANAMLSIDCTCDGKKQTPAISWKDAPDTTKSFAISLWHTAPDQEKSYWLVYNIPATTRSISQDERPTGTVGLNDRRKAEYDPMCSKGPGVKVYHLTVFALSQKLDLPPEKATRAALLDAIKDITISQGTLDFKYERKKP